MTQDEKKVIDQAISAVDEVLLRAPVFTDVRLACDLKLILINMRSGDLEMARSHIECIRRIGRQSRDDPA